ncbi:MAG: hypothetical protein AAF449_06595 [Myxococcota bacterium]
MSDRRTDPTHDLKTETDAQLTELHAQAQTEIAAFTKTPKQLRQLVQFAQAQPEKVVLLGFLKPPVLPDDLTDDDIDESSFELFVLVQKYNQVLLDSGIYTFEDYTKFMFKGLTPNS